MVGLLEALFGLQGWRTPAASSALLPCQPPEILRYQVLHETLRSLPGYTEGLVYRNGFLYESIGGYRGSRLQRLDPVSGRVQVLARLPDSQFGEGLANDGDIFYQLKWKEHRLLKWSARGEFLGSFVYPFEGWGLTRGPGGMWIASDGSSELRIFNQVPESGPWQASSSVFVRREGELVSRLNELEFAKGALYANLFQQNQIARIDPSTGCVTGSLDLGSLVSLQKNGPAVDPEAVLNGIAFRADHGSFYVTGKNWSSVYEIRITGNS